MSRERFEQLWNKKDKKGEGILPATECLKILKTIEREVGETKTFGLDYVASAGKNGMVQKEAFRKFVKTNLKFKQLEKDMDKPFEKTAPKKVKLVQRNVQNKLVRISEMPQIGLCVLLCETEDIWKKKFHVVRTPRKNSYFAEKFFGEERRKQFAAPKNHLLFLEVGKHNLEEVHVEVSEFRLEDVPKALVPDILMYIDTDDVMQMCELNKGWKRAVDHDGHWRKRCFKELTHIVDVEKEFKNSQLSWKEFYKHYRLWKIIVHCYNSSRHELLPSEEFFLPAASKVSELLRVWRASVNNKRFYMTVTNLIPYDPSIVDQLDESGPNCNFDATNTDATLSEAGLINGAALCFTLEEMQHFVVTD